MINQSVETPRSLVRHLTGVVDQVKSISPDKDASEEERKVLETMKNDFFKSVHDAIMAAKNYGQAKSQHIHDVQYYRYLLNEPGPEAQSRYKKHITNADSRRRIAHERMMSEFNKANRLAKLFFDASTDPDEIPEQFSKIKERVLDTSFERLDLPVNIFTPNPTGLTTRERYADVADRLTEGLMDKNQLVDSLKQAMTETEK